jgi:hypothetical protein
MEIKTIYNSTNDVMRILGQQCVCSLINDDFVAVMNAHKDYHGIKDTNKLFEIAIDFYSLGIVTGKRLDRAERARKEYKTLTENA